MEWIPQQGTRREQAGNTQRARREHAGNMQGTRRAGTLRWHRAAEPASAAEPECCTPLMCDLSLYKNFDWMFSFLNQFIKL